MGAIRVHEFISADGVFENPSWTAQFGFTAAMGQAIAGLTTSSTAILLGRSTFELFAPAWSTRGADDDPGAPFFNDTPKHVVSSTLTSAGQWQNSTVLGPYDTDALRAFKEGVAGGVYVSGSGTLARALLADGLVDELHLFQYPIVLGTGAKLFDGMPPTPLALAAHEEFDNGVVHLTYVPAPAQ